MAYNPLVVEVEYRNQKFKDAVVGLEALARDFERSWNGIPAILSDELKKYLNYVAAELARRHGNAWPGGTTPLTLSKRSGTLIESVIKSVKVTSDGTVEGIKGEMGGNFYAVVHEYGAVITVKKAKWLTIPLSAALDNRGIPLKKSAKEWNNTFVARSKKGNLLIFRKEGGRKIVPLYALKKRVKIPPRLGMRETVQTGLPYFVDKAVDRMLAGLKILETS